MADQEQKYKIRVIDGDRVEPFCINFGEDPFNSKKGNRRTVVFPNFEEANDYAKRLKFKYPHRVYQVVTAETVITGTLFEPNGNYNL